MHGRCGSWWRGGMATPFVGGGFPWGRGGRWGRFFGPGEIRLALLSMLESGPKHGYELMKELETKSGGIYKASAGAIYPALQQLEDEGMVTSDAAAGKRTYSLTEAGRGRIADRRGNRQKDMATCRTSRRLGPVDGDGRGRGDAPGVRSDEDGAQGGDPRHARCRRKLRRSAKSWNERRTRSKD